MLALLACLARESPAAAARGTIRVSVDARDAPRRILRVRLSVPVTPGRLSLSYPIWIPGTHAPFGPINDLVGPRLSAAGRPLAWQRDPVDLSTFFCTVPAGARSVEASYEVASPSESKPLSADVWATDRLALVDWNPVVLYPAGAPSDSLTFEASLRLPAGWRYATSLPVASQSGGEIRFSPTSLTTLVDSPVQAGVHMRSIPLDRPGHPRPVTLDVACDSEEGLAVPDSEVVHLRRLVAEADGLFGARHFRWYRFLLSLSDHIEHFGLEHHESSDDRLDERSWIESDLLVTNAMLLPHEYVHSWNGKYRRPAGLATRHYGEPMRDELLWVYEGLTQYLGWVLAVRSGLMPADRGREYLASAAAYLDAEPGRGWRSLHDTAVDAPKLLLAPTEWRSWRRSVDYYNEGLLIWLDADVTIRRLTGGRRSLDDFCRAFHGGESGPPRVSPYTRDDLVAALNAVAPYDWRSFFAQRVDSVTARAPLGGIERGGWTIGWSDSATSFFKAAERDRHRMELHFSLGARLDSGSGAIQDVLAGGPADRAGAAPGMKVVAVNGRKWTKDVLLDAIRASRTSGRPIELTVEAGEFVRTLRVDWRGGLRYPRLERAGGAPDVLSQILAPRTPRTVESRRP